MIFKKSFFAILIRVLTMLGLAVAIAHTYYNTDLSITPAMFGVLLFIAVLELSWRLQRQERNWANFLKSVKYGDFNRSYQHQADSTELREAYDLISRSMEALQTNKEAEFRLLQTVLRHVSIAVVCYTDEGEVRFTNKAFNELLEIAGLGQVDHLQERYPKIHQVMTTESTAPSEWIDHENGQKLLVRTESFKLKDKSMRLASLTDIRSSLDAKELDSYQKLMRVMTHEIMNSTTPILSLIRVVNKKLISGDELLQLNDRDQKNVSISLRAMEERTSDMLRFVEAYKQINRPIAVHRETAESQQLIDAVTTLMLNDSAVALTVNDQIEGPLSLDKALMTQVLINLVKNALDALKEVEKPLLRITTDQTSAKTSITVEDNGPGVAENAVQEIFVPFYTTKAEGSGIGLALSRKIVRAHGGLLEYKRINGFTSFTISLPQEK